MQLGRTHPVTVPVWGELGVTCDILCAQLPEDAGEGKDDQTSQLVERWGLWCEEKSREGDDRGRGVNSASIFASMNRLVPEDIVVPVDVGNNTYSFGRYYESKANNTVLMSGYLGSIGFGRSSVSPATAASACTWRS